MSLPNEKITIQEEAVLIRDFLGTWAKPRGGETKVMANIRHLWEEVLTVNDKPRVLICYEGEQSRGLFSVANTLHRVDRRWMVVVMRGHGFNALMEKGQGVPNTPAAIEPFYDSVESLRDMIRVMNNITEEPPVDYKGTRPLPNVGSIGQQGNVFLDAYMIEFTTANDIQAITTQEP